MFQGADCCGSHCKTILWVSRSGKSLVTARRFLAAPHRGPFAQRKAQRESHTDCALILIADNVQCCVRCGHLTHTSNNYIGPAMSGAGSLLLWHRRESKWISHLMWIPSDSLLLLSGFVSLACRRRCTKTWSHVEKKYEIVLWHEFRAKLFCASVHSGSQCSKIVVTVLHTISIGHVK